MLVFHTATVVALADWASRSETSSPQPPAPHPLDTDGGHALLVEELRVVPQHATSRARVRLCCAGSWCRPSPSVRRGVSARRLRCQGQARRIRAFCVPRVASPRVLWRDLWRRCRSCG
jgi:hypothetical protein